MVAQACACISSIWSLIDDAPKADLDFAVYFLKVRM